MMKKMVLFWMLAGSLLLAQKVTQIKFIGLAHLSPSMALEVADIRVGDQMDAEKIDDSIKNFFEQGYFKDVWVDRKGGTLTYHFDEKRSIANIEIKGYGSGDDGKKLKGNLGLKKGDLYDAARIAQAKKTLVAQLEAKGNYDSVVEVTVKPVGDSAMSVVFDVNKGEKIKIKKLNFIGANELSQSDLETGIVNQEEDMLGWIPFYFHSGEVKVDQLEYDAFRVKETYMKHGYLDATVSKPLMRVDYSSYSAEIDYQIKEGVQYRVGKISVSQNIPGLDTSTLLNDLTLKKGRIFNIDRMRKDMKKLESAAGDLGYAYAKASPQMHKDPEKKAVNIEYNLKAGSKVTINDVLISGNDTTKDRVIRRYIYLAPGDKFSATDLRDSKSALGRTGFFEKVDIQSQRVSDDKINLLVKVKETSTGTISAGGGYGSYEGLMVNASISDKNLFGSGLNTTLGFEISKISKNYNLSFVNPRLWDSRYSLGLNIYKRDYEYIDYTQDQFGSSLNIGREFLRHFYGSLGIGYVDNQSEYNEDYKPVNSINVNFYRDQYTKASGFISLKYDNRDDYYLPREGILVSFNGEYAQMDGDMQDVNVARGYSEFDDFTKINARFGAFYGVRDLIDYDLIFRFKARYTKIISKDDEYIPIAERMFMGGIGSVRGYDPYSISPRVVESSTGARAATDDDVHGDRIGGTERTSFTAEASIPLSEAAKMRLTAFFDYGIMGTDPVQRNVGNEPLEFEDITRYSTGVVLEWQSSFGQINLVFAYPLVEEVWDQKASFEFSMGSKF
jgi:outer membrane protein insertion porin family